MSINKKRVSEFLVGKTIGNCDTFFFMHGLVFFINESAYIVAIQWR
jgi:hypothetical protein